MEYAGTEMYVVGKQAVRVRSRLHCVHLQVLIHRPLALLFGFYLPSLSCLVDVMRDLRNSWY